MLHECATQLDDFGKQERALGQIAAQEVGFQMACIGAFENQGAPSCSALVTIITQYL